MIIYGLNATSRLQASMTHYKCGRLLMLMRIVNFSCLSMSLPARCTSEWA